jgi:HAT1-interacting factor 1
MTTETQDISEQTVIEPTAMELKKEELKTEVVQVEPTEETADVEETEEAEEEKTLEDAADLISAGTQALALANYEEAAEKLALAVEIQVSHLGQYALEVAPSFHLYGKALLQAAIVKNSVLGEKADQVKPMEQSSSKTDSKIVFEESDLEDEGQDLNDLEEPADDLELAWENLDVARLILSKQSEKEYILQLADVHLSLGDVSLESGIFS